MSTPSTTFVCPHCGEPIELNTALSKQLQHQLRDEMKAEIEVEKKKLWKVAQEKAAEKQEKEVRDLQEQLKERTDKLQEAETQELELRKQARELAEKQKSLELEIARTLDKEREKIALDARKQADEAHRLKDLEKDKKLQDAQKANEELARKLQQGSMQTQGEVLEADLKALLEQAFPTDSIQDVEKGVKGADVVQTVHTKTGERSGVIVWESKNTKAWSQSWVTKLKQDQHTVKADICVLVSTALPAGVETYTMISGVWVVHPSVAHLVATALRMQLLATHQARQSLVGREEKMEVLYAYLSGTQFKARVENIISAFIQMQEGLQKEKRAMQTQWSKREREIERVIANTTGMYGDLQGIIGAQLPEIAQLQLPDEAPEGEQLELTA
ncbi:MAG: DUF2130 domain-containing protein [Pseudomonadales bacterium]|nr:DUF2130 domain-containing protein [Pseudomonadales bacterium]